MLKEVARENRDAPTRQRQCGRHLSGPSTSLQRRACHVLEQPRSTQRQVPAERQEEEPAGGTDAGVGGQHPRFGYRRIWALLRREGWRVNRKRVYRLWRQQGLKVPRKKRKKRRLGRATNGCVRRRAVAQGPRVGVGFHPRPHGGRAAPEVAERGGRVHARVRGPEVGRSMTAEAVRQCWPSWSGSGRTGAHPHGQRAGVHRRRDPGAGCGGGGGGVVHRAGVAVGERLRGVVPQPAAGRVAGREEFSSQLEARVLGAEWRRRTTTSGPTARWGIRRRRSSQARCPRPDAAKPSPSRGHKSSG